MKTRFLPALLLLATLGFSHAAERPNIVLIFTDDQGYGDIGCFGAKDLATPHLDALAREGRRFTNFHVAQAVCTASRAALLTGCYPNRLGLHGALGPKSRVGLNPDETTLAELLKARGYATALVGKWHLGDAPAFLPTRQGFDEYFGLPYSNDMWPHHPEAKPGTYPPLPLFEGDQVIDPDVAPDEQAQLTKRYAERAVQFVDRHKDAPFFLYLAPNMPHVPLVAGEKFRGINTVRGLYGEVIAEIDWAVGEVLGALRRHGLEKNTLVIFTSDNGPWLSYGEHAGSAGPLREGKGTIWEGGTRVPCLMRWPGYIPAGTECAEPLMTIDLLPTIAAVTGAEMPARTIDGLDVRPLLTGEAGAKTPHDAYFFYYNQNELQAVTSGNWKLVLPHKYRTLGDQPRASGGVPVKYRQVFGEKPELYQLADDPGEKTDLAAQHPDRVEALLALAERARGDLGDALTGRVGSGVRPPGRLAP